MRRTDLSSAVLLLAGAAFFVDLFVRWGPSSNGGFVSKFSGWDISLISTAGEAALALVLVELGRMTDLWRTPTSALLGFFLATGAGILALGGLVRLRWAAFYGLKFGRWGYGAWIGLVLALALLFGAYLRRVEHRSGSTQ